MPETPYYGDVGLAHRLFAARHAAGFQSARAAAAKFGWRQAIYRAHETANRLAPEESVRAYAQAFGVKEEWLRTGRGRGPEPPATRRDMFKLRRKAAKARHAVPRHAAGKRVRLARRLAGFGSVTAAAKYFGFPRTTLNGRETGQNSVSPTAARLYALAFGADATWIAEGTLPSGYSREIESQLDALIGLHAASEAQARRKLKGFMVPHGDPHDVAVAMRRPKSASPRKEKGDRVPEIAADQVRRLAEEGLGEKTRSSGLWTFPPGYLSETMGCDPRGAAIVAAPHDVGPNRRFDRLVIDTRARTPVVGSSYLVVDGDSGATLMLVTAGFSLPVGRLLIAGQVTGVIAAVGPRR